MEVGDVDLFALAERRRSSGSSSGVNGMLNGSSGDVEAVHADAVDDARPGGRCDDEDLVAGRGRRWARSWTCISMPPTWGT